MCAPPYFGVQYIINPWMEGQINATSGDVATRQWSNFHQTLAKAADVALLPPVEGLPDLVFTANGAVVFGRTAVLSSFRHPERQSEEAHFETWLADDGFTVHSLPREVSFEGAGDALFDRGQPLLWFGHGFRSDLNAAPLLAASMGVEMQPLRLINPRFYHLDTCFCPLEGGRLLYYPGAFDGASVATIERRVPAAKRFAVSDQDAADFACNAVNVAGTVILNRASGALKGWLQSQCFTVVESPMSEFLKAGGSTKCLSLRLDEGYPSIC